MFFNKLALLNIICDQIFPKKGMIYEFHESHEYSYESHEIQTFMKIMNNPVMNANTNSNTVPHGFPSGSTRNYYYYYYY